MPKGQPTKPKKGKKEITSIISMAPINSSGDIYHIAAFIMLQKSKKEHVPTVVLSYDTDSNPSGSQTDTKGQVERSLSFVDSLGLGEFFNNPFLPKELNQCLPSEFVDVIQKYIDPFESRTLHLAQQKGSRTNLRQKKLEATFQDAAGTEDEIHYTDQRAATTLLSYAYRRDRAATSKVLKEGFQYRDPKVISKTSAHILKEYAEYWIQEITKSRQKENQPLVLLHIRRHTAGTTTNNKQDVDDNFLNKFVEYLKNKGILVWFVFADSRMKGSFAGIKGQRISPFSKILQKDKGKHKECQAIEKQLSTENPGFDFSKLKHLELLLAMQRLDFLIGVVGNTSGTLDVAAFVGHAVYNMHSFKNKLSYQDYRILLQMSFLTVEGLAPKSKEENSVTDRLENFKAWLKSRLNNKGKTSEPPALIPSIDFTEPKLTNANFNTMFYYKVFQNQKKSGTLKEIPEAASVAKFVRKRFGAS